MNYASKTVYEGQGRCRTTHNATGKGFATDLHKDIGGLEENPSPGEMLAATLASCMMSMVSFIASRKDIDVKGMVIESAPEAGSDGSIKRIPLRITMPLPGDLPMRKALEASALTCPVHRALNPSIETPIEWIWK